MHYIKNTKRSLLKNISQLSVRLLRVAGSDTAGYKDAEGHFEGFAQIVLADFIKLRNKLSSNIFNRQMSDGLEHSIDDYELLTVIGKGVFGKIFLVRELKSGHVYAMKVVKKKLIEKQNKLKYIFTERNVLIELDHPFIIRVTAAFQSEEKFYFILQYCPGGELYNLLAIKEKFAEEQSKFYISQIILALDYLHAKDIVYRDLKPENIMIDKRGFIKLTDFGLSKKIKRGQENVFSISGMPEYTAPEILFQKDCTKAVDFWCLGSLLHEMVTGFPPFFSENLNELYQSIKFDDFTVDPEFGLSKECVNLLEELFNKDPDWRLGVQDIEVLKMHPWFQGINWVAVEGCKYKPPFVPILKSDQDTTYFSAAITASSLESVSSYSSGMNRDIEPTENKYFSGFDYNPDQENEVSN